MSVGTDTDAGAKMPASITIDDTHPLFPRVLALLAGVAAPADSLLPPAATAEPVTQRAPAARSGSRPATVGPAKSAGGTLSLLPLADPAATPPTVSASTGMVDAPAPDAGDAQRGTVGLDDKTDVAESASGTPSTSGAAVVSSGCIRAAAPEVSPEQRAADAVAASPVVAKIVAMTKGAVDHVAPSLLTIADEPAARPATRGPKRSTPASTDAPASPEGWILSESAMKAADF